MEQCVDAVIVFGGTNDFGHGDAPIGYFGDTAAGVYLVGYQDNKLVWVDIVPCTLKPGDTVVSKIMELDNTKSYNSLKVFVWNGELSPLT